MSRDSMYFPYNGSVHTTIASVVAVCQSAVLSRLLPLGHIGGQHPKGCSGVSRFMLRYPYWSLYAIGSLQLSPLLSPRPRGHGVLRGIKELIRGTLSLISGPCRTDWNAQYAIP